MSDSLRPHESQHARPPCPSPAPGVHSNSRPSSRWCHPAISSSVVPFSSCPQSLPESEFFPMSQLFAWGGQSTGVSALASFLPKNTQGWSPLEWTGWISLQSLWWYKVIVIYKTSLRIQMMGDLGGNQKQTLKVEKVSWIHSHWELSRSRSSASCFIQPLLSPCPGQGKNITGLGRKADDGSRLVTWRLGWHRNNLGPIRKTLFLCIMKLQAEAKI